MVKKSLKKKTAGKVSSKSEQKKTNRIKAIVLLIVALFFFAYMIYAGGSLGSFFSLVIGLVCGLIGILYLRGGEKTGIKKK
jgi:1,4-dihydroxy-2-naphthoate octaprenyltransferase